MRIMTIILFLGLIAGTACDSRPPAEQGSPARPNILFILVDDLGLTDLGYTGSTYYETPHIDQLADRSLVFTQAYAGSRVCSPSRATILTGQFTARHGITDWIGAQSGVSWRDLNRHDRLLPADYQHQLPAEEVTLAEALRAQGYRTFFAGKWHLGGEGSYPEDRGFDINIGGWEAGSPKGGYFAPFDNPRLPDQAAGENLTLRLARETAACLQRQGDQPFFAMLSFYAVHGPIQTTEDRWAKYRDKAVARGISDTGFIMERHLPIRQTQDNPVYAGLVETMDEAVGIVLEQLRLSGLDQKTIVVFTSDNGGVASGDAYSTSNLPFRGGKGYQWEAGIRAPLLLCLPWRKSGPRKVDFPVTSADLYPTLLDYAHLDAPLQQLDGISLKPSIDEGVAPPERPLYWHYPHYGNQGGDPSSIIRQGRWKLIHYYEDGADELYDLATDPYEAHEVSADFPGIARELGARLQGWLREVGARYPEPDAQFDASARAAYEARIINQRLPKLEAERRWMLSEDFTPNPDWWGSKLTKD